MKKTIIKKTGEIVTIISFDTNGFWTKYIDSNGKTINSSLNYYEDFETISEGIDWEERRFEAAEHILAAMLVNPSIQMGNINGLAQISIQAADTLIAEFNKNKN